MKLLLSLLLLSSTNIYAQKWEIRAGAGATYMTLPKGSAYFSTSSQNNDWKTKTSPTLSGSLSVGHSFISERYMLGLRLSMSSLRRYAGPTRAFLPALNDSTSKLYIYAGHPAYFIQPYISYQYKGFFGGLQAGIVHHTIRRNADYDSKTEFRFVGSAFTGFAGGVHAGYKRQFSKHLSLVGELSCNYISVKEAYMMTPEETLRFFQPMAVVGLSYGSLQKK